MVGTGTVGVSSIARVRELQALLARGGEPDSQRAVVSAAVDWTASTIEGGGAFYNNEALASMMRRKTLEAVVFNLESALRTFDKEARYSVVADADTDNIEITRKTPDGNSLTVILVARAAPAKDGNYDDRAENRAPLVRSSATAE